MPRALISVHDKTDLIPFATTLTQLGWDIVASGGTERALRDAGLPVTPIEQLTQLPEMLGGRVKTLHPAIHAGILARDRAEDVAELDAHGYAPINMVVCNLYPFTETVAKPNIALQDAIEQIDIGGVTLIRGAAKNFLSVVVVCDSADYRRVEAALRAAGEVDMALRRDLAVKAFAHTSDYDTAIHAYLQRVSGVASSEVNPELPTQLSLSVQRGEVLRYGENPHQIAAYYSAEQGEGPLGGTLLSGKALSYTNILDIDAAWRAASSFDAPSVVIVKHLTPCGVAVGSTIAEAFPKALASDPLSAFGCAMAVNREVDEAFVESLGSLMIDDIAAPGFTQGALTILGAKRKNCRLLQIPYPYSGSEMEIRSVHRGFLVQRADVGDPDGTSMRVVTQRAPTDSEMKAMRFAWRAMQHVKSNAIVIAGEDATYGIGGGVTSRVDAARLAVAKAGERAKGAVMASDGLIPFADGLEAVAEVGVTAVIQPGGSIRDAEVIEAANRYGIAMVFTGVRHFRH
ncbi:MAG: bifunctional phosphoribosylaminoimidazolecarboxamide formyltransferase/IMP cyclohydrolase [Anaerolineae bacterium]|jgi:phosphoribosylaminoimidazolecarboxamide formyltransferase/IMP cyclohydrolase|nr:bifunctional phosphoribosylaminoimidazolecarboxamide formyltransferase/IMP cyclohydrolase [Anaerolineae bacterium]